ncbi:hypothetical protein [Streptomyces sp. NPDC050546]|uniref:hypothetical protein n=1 Tax=Streptomyces sp. NPDC050546 TaxID=3365628 RepID=UPI00378D8C6F
MEINEATAAVLPHALHGFGEVGKSQLALEYVYTYKHDYKVIWCDGFLTWADGRLKPLADRTPGGSQLDRRSSSPADSSRQPTTVELE